MLVQPDWQPMEARREQRGRERLEWGIQMVRPEREKRLGEYQ